VNIVCISKARNSVFTRIDDDSYAFFGKQYLANQQMLLKGVWKTTMNVRVPFLSMGVEHLPMPFLSSHVYR
jgi:hypothetical protein